jgi:hypothetical protein
VRLVEHERPPARLLLGSDAVTIARAEAEAPAADDAAWAQFGRSTDRDGATDAERGPLGTDAARSA